MKIQTILFLSIFFSCSIFAQNTLNTQQIIKLGKFYSSYMFTYDASNELLTELNEVYDYNLIDAVQLIKEATKSNNAILTDTFLKLPNKTTLKVIYIIDALHQNPHLKSPMDPVQLVDKLKNKNIPIHYLIDQYYQTIFTTVGNKIKPFNLSKINFRMNAYGLNTDRYKAIFYLRCLDMCGSQIFGFMNIANPPNTNKALSYINLFPKFNGLNYYQYNTLQFEDFQMEIFNDQGLKSYKDHFINELFKTLLSHAVCLKSERNSQEVQDFFKQSELRNETLWKHTEFQDVLKSIYKKR